MFALLVVRRQDDVEGEGLASLLALREQQTLGVATVAFSLQREERTMTRVLSEQCMTGCGPIRVITYRLVLSWKNTGNEVLRLVFGPRRDKMTKDGKIILVCYFTKLPVTRLYSIEW